MVHGGELGLGVITHAKGSSTYEPDNVLQISGSSLSDACGLPLSYRVIHGRFLTGRVRGAQQYPTVDRRSADFDNTAHNNNQRAWREPHTKRSTPSRENASWATASCSCTCSTCRGSCGRGLALSSAVHNPPTQHRTVDTSITLCCGTRGALCSSSV